MSIKNNKLIAEFMGYKILDDGISQWIYYIAQPFVNGRINVNAGTKCTMQITNLYNTSRDWLMSVVEKIKSDEFFEPIAGDGVAYVMDLAIDEALATAKIEKVYGAVIGFITWYNAIPPTAKKSWHMIFKTNGKRLLEYWQATPKKDMPYLAVTLEKFLRDTYNKYKLLNHRLGKETISFAKWLQSYS